MKYNLFLNIFKVKNWDNSENTGARLINYEIMHLELCHLSFYYWFMMRNIFVKFEVDTLRNENDIVKYILLRKMFNL
jgi:hypothetical protein